MIKTQNQIFTDLKALIESALATAEITGWLVAQNYNPTQGHWNQPSIIMHRVRTEQYGAVGQQYRKEEDKLVLDVVESKEVTLQIDAICPRDLTGTNKWEAADIINFLRRYFSGPFGVAALKEKGIDAEKHNNLIIREYINDMPRCLAAADLVISRCGAITLAEIRAAGKASVLIPSPNVAENHQYHNAMVLANHGAAVVIEE